MFSRNRFATAVLASLMSSAALAQVAASEFEKPFPPYTVAGNLHFVGTAGLSNYLITTTRCNWAAPHWWRT
jgi:hypothetical protein